VRGHHSDHYVLGWESLLARWGIETNFAHLKTTMGLDVLKCKTVDGVLKELIVFSLIYNLVRLAMGPSGSLAAA
jgi:hypothetical protein